MRVGDLVTYKEAEYGLVGVVVELLGEVQENTAFYEMAKSYYFYNNDDDTTWPAIELCRVFWLQAGYTYVEYVHELETISEGR